MSNLDREESLEDKLKKLQRPSLETKLKNLKRALISVHTTSEFPSTMRDHLKFLENKISLAYSAEEQICHLIHLAKTLNHLHEGRLAHHYLENAMQKVSKCEDKIEAYAKIRETAHGIEDTSLADHTGTLIVKFIKKQIEEIDAISDKYIKIEKWEKIGAHLMYSKPSLPLDLLELCCKKICDLTLNHLDDPEFVEDSWRKLQCVVLGLTESKENISVQAIGEKIIDLEHIIACKIHNIPPLAKIVDVAENYAKLGQINKAFKTLYDSKYIPSKQEECRIYERAIEYYLYSDDFETADEYLTKAINSAPEEKCTLINYFMLNADNISNWNNERYYSLRQKYLDLKKDSRDFNITRCIVISALKSEHIGDAMDYIRSFELKKGTESLPSFESLLLKSSEAAKIVLYNNVMDITLKQKEFTVAERVFRESILPQENLLADVSAIDIPLWNKEQIFVELINHHLNANNPKRAEELIKLTKQYTSPKAIQSLIAFYLNNNKSEIAQQYIKEMISSSNKLPNENIPDIIEFLSRNKYLQEAQQLLQKISDQNVYISSVINMLPYFKKD